MCIFLYDLEGLQDLQCLKHSTHWLYQSTPKKKIKSYMYIFPAGSYSFHISPVYEIFTCKPNKFNGGTLKCLYLQGYRFHLKTVALFISILNFLQCKSHISSYQVLLLLMDQDERIFMFFILVDLQFEFGMVIKTETWIIHNLESLTTRQNDQS